MCMEWKTSSRRKNDVKKTCNIWNVLVRMTRQRGASLASSPYYSDFASPLTKIHYGLTAKGTYQRKDRQVATGSGSLIG